MTKIRTLARSFAGGEIAPELYGRVDLDKYQTGLAACVNFIPLTHGPVQTRAGFRYVNEVKDSTKVTRLVPFSFSADQTIVIEMGAGYFRFHTNGGTILESTKAISSIAGSTVNCTGHGYSIGQWVFIGGRFYRVATVPGVNSFTVNNLDSTAGAPVGTTAARIYEVAHTYAEVDLFDVHYVQSNDVLTLTHPSYPVKELRRTSATNWSFIDASFAALLSPPGSVSSTRGRDAGTTSDRTYSYCVTAVDESGINESEASATTAQSNNLGQFNNTNTVTWAAVAGAARYNVYRVKSGTPGYIGQTSDLSFTDDNIVPDMTKSTPEYTNPFNASDKYPSCATYFDQRRCFGATNNLPQSVWMTRPGTEGNFGLSFPTISNDPISFKIAAREQNRIRHLIPLGDLLALTAGGEWRIYNGNGDPVTPQTVMARPQSYVGATNAQPMVTAFSALYVQSQGSHVRELTYDNQGQGGYKSEDISILAPHLVDGYTVTELAYSRGPIPMMWAVRSDGTLLGLTYEPAQKVRAWHQHTSEGGDAQFESVTCVAEGNEDVLYVVVNRTVDGRTVRYIERKDPQLFANSYGAAGVSAPKATEAFCVDSGLTYRGAPVSVISGLWHLEGKAVSILADGAVMPQAVVTEGTVTIAQPASVIHIGLPIYAYIYTLPATFEAPAFGQATVKSVTKVTLRVNRSSGIFAGPDLASLREYKQRTTEVYGEAPNIVGGEVDIPLTGAWRDGGQIAVVQTDPLPLTIQSMVLEVAVGG
jgi:hypothetical protein